MRALAEVYASADAQERFERAVAPRPLAARGGVPCPRC